MELNSFHSDVCFGIFFIGEVLKISGIEETPPLLTVKSEQQNFYSFHSFYTALTVHFVGMLQCKIQLLYCSVISNCIQLLVQDLETACEPALTAMSKVRNFIFSTDL